MSNGTDSILPASLKDVWDPKVAESFGKLSIDHQSFVLAYLANGRNASAAYKESYAGRGDEKYAGRYGWEIVNRQDVEAFLEHFKTRKFQALQRVERVYHEAMEAEIAVIVEGKPIPGTERPDHDVRTRAAKEYAKLHGLNAPEEVKIDAGEAMRGFLEKLKGSA